MILFKLIYTIYLFVIVISTFIIGTTVTLFFVPFSKTKSRPFQIAARIWAKLLLFFCFIRLEVIGRENIPKDKPVLIAANHQGFADILIVLAAMPVYFRFAIKKELFSIPFFGWYLKKAGYFPIDRKIILSVYKTVEVMEKIFNEGDSVLIFPEGTRSKTGQLGVFKRGSLVTALETGCPVIPISISGSYNIMPRGNLFAWPHPVRLTISPPVYITAEETYDNRVKEIRDAVAKNL
ncbi:MAG: lysophospholipid acyltransferase family protein [Candidatus Margulisiibacteriota bacterium]